MQKFPKSEHFLLSDQMKRACRSIPALIAEGYAKRETLPVFKKLLRDAIGEANEMINHIAFAKAQNYIDEKYVDDLINRYHITGKKLTRLKENWTNY